MSKENGVRVPRMKFFVYFSIEAPRKGGAGGHIGSLSPHQPGYGAQQRTSDFLALPSILGLLCRESSKDGGRVHIFNKK